MPASRRSRVRWLAGAAFVFLPEPSRYLLLAAGLGCLMVLHRVSRRG